MSVPTEPLVLAIAGLASSAAEAQLLGLGFESNISLTEQDLDIIRQTVSRQIHGKPVGATASWHNASSQTSGTIRLLKKFTARNIHHEEIGYALMTTAMAVSPRTLRIGQLSATGRKLDDTIASVSFDRVQPSV